MNPCKECVVRATCTNSCDAYDSYVFRAIYCWGYDVQPPVNAGPWIRYNIESKRFHIEAFKISTNEKYQLSVKYNNSGTITEVLEIGKRYQI